MRAIFMGFPFRCDAARVQCRAAEEPDQAALPCHPDEGRDPFLPWIPAFAGMTKMMLSLLSRHTRSTIHGILAEEHPVHAPIDNIAGCALIIGFFIPGRVKVLLSALAQIGTLYGSDSMKIVAKRRWSHWHFT
jgi:hypothetical protein